MDPKISVITGEHCNDIDIIIQWNILIDILTFLIGFAGLRPLHRACLRGDSEIINSLLKYGADPNACNDAGETPFHFACKRGGLPLIKFLIENGANVTAQDNLGRNGMHHAAQSDST